MSFAQQSSQMAIPMGPGPHRESLGKQYQMLPPPLREDSLERNVVTALEGVPTV